MSAHEQDEGHAAQADHDDHAPFDAEPVAVLADDEAPSPMWLPLLGVGLVIALALYASLSGEDAQAAAPAASASATATAAPVATAPTPVQPQILPPQLRQPQDRRRLAQPTGSGGLVRPPTRADKDRARRMLEQQREARGLRPPTPTPAPAPAPGH